MAFSKTDFVDNQTVIDADTLNAIQDELIRVAGLLGKGHRRGHSRSGQGSDRQRIQYLLC